MATRAVDVPASHQWKSDPFHKESSFWSELLVRNPALLGFGITSGLLILGWVFRDKNWLNAGEGLGYALGFVSVTCMVTLLLYPLRKRFRLLKFIGPLPKWFKVHMTLGVTAPLTALYHCNFQPGSLNSKIALYSALAVAGSGLVGRFIYSKIHRGLYGRKTSLRELLAKVKLTAPGVGRLGAFIPDLTERISKFDKEVLVAPDTLLDCFILPFRLSYKTRVEYFHLMRFTKVSLALQAQRSKAIEKHQKKLRRAVRVHVKNHLYHVRRVAEFTAYDRLFALWHKLHFPFFVLLLVTVTIHVAVVYLY